MESQKRGMATVEGCDCLNKTGLFGTEDGDCILANNFFLYRTLLDLFQLNSFRLSSSLSCMLSLNSPVWISSFLMEWFWGRIYEILSLMRMLERNCKKRCPVNFERCLSHIARQKSSSAPQNSLNSSLFLNLERLLNILSRSQKVSTSSNPPCFIKSKKPLQVITLLAGGTSEKQRGSAVLFLQYYRNFDCSCWLMTALYELRVGSGPTGASTGDSAWRVRCQVYDLWRLLGDQLIPSFLCLSSDSDWNFRLSSLNKLYWRFLAQYYF